MKYNTRGRQRVMVIVSLLIPLQILQLTYLGDHSISGANRLLAMKVPPAFLHEPMSIYSVKTITLTEEEHEQHRSDGGGVSTAYLDTRNQAVTFLTDGG